MHILQKPATWCNLKVFPIVKLQYHWFLCIFSQSLQPSCLFDLVSLFLILSNDGVFFCYRTVDETSYLHYPITIKNFLDIFRWCKQRIVEEAIEKDAQTSVMSILLAHQSMNNTDWKWVKLFSLATVAEQMSMFLRRVSTLIDVVQYRWVAAINEELWTLF